MEILEILEIVKQPWPWYVAGPLVGLTVPALYLLGNKSFGISSSLRHACAAVFPAKIAFFQYEWKKELWNIVFVVGIMIGGFIASNVLANPHPIVINENLRAELTSYGITTISESLPTQIFSWQGLAHPRGIIIMVFGGFMIGFGSRYAGGCTSGHAITGLSHLQWPSLVATCCFMIGGFIMANVILPLILSL
jgi:uncharacterized membrane protein YedE/YeeE